MNPHRLLFTIRAAKLANVAGLAGCVGLWIGCTLTAPAPLNQQGPAIPADGAFREFQSALVIRNEFGVLASFSDSLLQAPSAERINQGLALARHLIDTLTPELEQAVVQTETVALQYDFDPDGRLQVARARLTARLHPLPEWDTGTRLIQPRLAPQAVVLVRTEWVAESLTWQLTRIEINKLGNTWRYPPDTMSWPDEF